jgi:hypothetical protein
MSHEPNVLNLPEKLAYIGAVVGATLGLYLSSLYSYLLFHSLIEVVTVAVAFALFILTWNTREYLANGLGRHFHLVKGESQ